VEGDIPMSGRKSKDKGYRHENQTAKRWRAKGLDCVRMPLSGALGGQWAGDLRATICGRELVIQLKALADGWKGIYSAIRNHDCLIIKADHEDPLVVMPEALFLSLICEPTPDANCETCGESYSGTHWCLNIANNKLLAERIAALKARRGDN